MNTRILGKTNLKTSVIGMGCWAIGGPFYHSNGRVIAYGHVKDEDSIAAIKKGVEMGVTLFDTANVYGVGRSERVLGDALKGIREDIVIATKFGSTADNLSGNPDIPGRLTGKDFTPEGIKNACNESLKRLQTNYIDFYQVHSGNMDAEEASLVVTTLEELVEEGKIRYYGWSTDYVNRGKLLSHGKHFAGMQFRLNLIHSNNEMLKFLNKHNCFALIKNPIAGGLLSGKYKDDTQRKKDHMLHGRNFAEGKLKQIRDTLEELKALLTEEDRTLVQVALGYVLSQHKQIIPIPGFKNIQQVEENVRVLDLDPLPKTLIEQIDIIFSKLRIDQSEVNG